MVLNFPNPSRSYDERRHSVRFWGHDGAFEICFIVEQAAFARIDPAATPDEFGYLNAFDRFRDRVLKVAAKAYSRSRGTSYTLAASDF